MSKIGFSLSLALIVVSLPVGCAQRGGAQSDEDIHPLVGRKAPLFTAGTLAGGDFELAKHLGESVIILDFWATWCGPCVKALPTIAEVAGQFKSKGVLFFAVDVGEDPTTVREFLDQQKFDISVVLDRDNNISNLYQVEGIPQTVIIGQDGTVKVVHIGLSPDLKARLTEELNEVLAAGGALATR